MLRFGGGRPCTKSTSSGHRMRTRKYSVYTPELESCIFTVHMGAREGSLVARTTM